MKLTKGQIKAPPRANSGRAAIIALRDATGMPLRMMHSGFCMERAMGGLVVRVTDESRWFLNLMQMNRLVQWKDFDILFFFPWKMDRVKLNDVVGFIRLK